MGALFADIIRSRKRNVCNGRVRPHHHRAGKDERPTLYPWNASDGTPCARSTEHYASREELRADYPELEDEDIRQALAYSAAMLADETVVTPATS
jgi:hypothetical protein